MLTIHGGGALPDTRISTGPWLALALTLALEGCVAVGVDDDDDSIANDDDSIANDDDSIANDDDTPWPPVCGAWSDDDDSPDPQFTCPGALPPRSLPGGSDDDLCAGGDPVEVIPAGWAYGEQAPTCAGVLGCEESLYAAVVGDQEALNATVTAFGGPTGTELTIDFGEHDALFVANFCGGGTLPMLVQCAAVGPGGELIVGVVHYIAGDSTGAETTHLAVACMEKRSWTGVDVRYRVDEGGFPYPLEG